MNKVYWLGANIFSKQGLSLKIFSHNGYFYHSGIQVGRLEYIQLIWGARGL